jgi:Gas vesicle protein
VSGSGTLYSSAGVRAPVARQVTLMDLLDRLLAGGIVVHGHIRLAVADIDLVDVDLALLVAAHDKASGR